MGPDSNLTPDVIEAKTFTSAFRGFDQLEVKSYLARLAEEIRALRTRADQLQSSLQSAQERAARPPVLDEDTLMAAVGEETASILRTARAAAGDMRTKAGEEAEKLLQEARAQGDRIREEASLALTRETRAAEEASLRILAAAKSEAAEMLEKVRIEADQIRAKAEQDRILTIDGANATRDRILEDLGRRRRVATVQIEQLRAGRERLVESYAVVRRTLEEVQSELSRADAEARAAADEVGQRLRNVPEPTLTEDRRRTPEPAGSSSAPAGSSSAPAGSSSAPAGSSSAPAGSSSAGYGLLVRSNTPPAGSEPGPAGSEPGPAGSEPGPAGPDITGPDISDPDVAGPDPAPNGSGSYAGETPGPYPTASDAPPEVESEADDPASAPPEADDPEAIPGDAIPGEAAATLSTDGADTDPGADEVTEDEPPAALAGAAVDELFAKIRFSRDQEPEPAEAETADPIDAEADETVLQRRESALIDLEVTLTRKLKRALQDEQNDLLDRLRGLKGSASASRLLPDVEYQVGRYVDAARPLVEQAALAGVQFADQCLGGDVNPGVPPTSDLATDAAIVIVEALRRRLEQAIHMSADEDQAVLIESLGAAYREWKSQRIERIAGDALTGSFSRGTWHATPDGYRLRWIVEDTDGPCPDCDDDALAGGIPKGEEFPTGQHYPPAHSGCRCLLVPVDRAGA